MIKRLERRGRKTKAITPIIEGLRGDGGGENFTKELTKLTVKLGISLEESLPYSQYQNGSAERVGGIVWGGGQALRLAAQAPEREWYRSMCTYGYIKNRLPNSKNPKTTPIEAFFQFESKNPIELIEHLKPFGCLCYVNYPKEVRKSKGKLLPKAWKGIFLGYSEDATDIPRPASRGYVIRNIQTGVVERVPYAQVSKFYETIFPYSDDYKHNNNNIYIDIERDIDRDNDNDSSNDDDMSSSDPCDENETNSTLTVKDDSDPHYDDDDDESDEDELYIDDNLYTHIEMGFPVSKGPKQYNLRNSQQAHRDADNDAGNSNAVNAGAGDGDNTEHKYNNNYNNKNETVSDNNSEVGGDSAGSNQMDDDVNADDVDVNDVKVGGDSAGSSHADADVNVDEKCGDYMLENIIAHKYAPNGGTNFLCQWDVDGDFEYSYESRSDLRKQGLDAYMLYDYNMKNNKDETFQVTDELEEKTGGSCDVYNHNDALIKNIYESREWDHDIGPTPTSDEGENSKVVASEIEKKINVIRKRIRKIKIEKIRLIEEERMNDRREEKGEELNFELEIEEERVRLLKKAKKKKFKKEKEREKGGVSIPTSYRDVCKRDDFAKWKEAMDKERQAFEVRDIFEPTLRSKVKALGKNVVSVRWVYDIKMNPDMKTIERYKARLVARGFQQRYGVDYDDVFAPTMNIKTMRILLAIAARDNVNVMQYDVSNAFLHASLDHDVYIEQPEGYDDPRYPRDEYVFKINKAIYGLKNAPKAWSQHFMKELCEKGFVQNSKDECLWTYREGDKYIHYLYHVDDIMVVSNDYDLRDNMLAKLKEKIDIREEGEVRKFLAMNVTRLDDGSYTIDQTNYIEKIAKRFGLDEERLKKRKTPGDYGSKLSIDDIPKTNDDKREAMKYDMPALVGALIYTIRTRFDVCYAVSDVSRFMSEWGVVL